MARKRIRFLFILFSIGSVLLITRLYYLQVVKHSWLRSMAFRESVTADSSHFRGVIFDRCGREMAMSVKVPSAFIITRTTEEPKAVLASIARLPWVDMSALREGFRQDKGFIWIKRMLHPNQKESLDRLGIEGIEYIDEAERFYPNGGVAGQVLGFVGLDGKGLEGIEFHFDRLLKLQAIWNGSPETFCCQGDIDEGEYSLCLTIDLPIQYIAEEALKRGCQEVDAQHGVVIIMNTRSGEIIAMANWPRYNPNCFAEYPPELWRNQCVSSMYEPGSTFKLFGVAALIEEGMCQADDIVYCEQGAISIAGFKIRDHKKFGWLNVAQVMEQSSNVGAIKLMQKLGSDRYFQYIKAFGFGEKTDIDFPGEASGLVWPPRQWSGLSLASIAIGQEISVTPIQMIRAFCALVNGGSLVKPLILRDIRDSKGAVLKQWSTQAVRNVISMHTSTQMKEILKGVVCNGTAKKAGLEGYCVGGKTGTAQLIDKKTGRYSHKDFLSSFIGFFPDHEAEYAMLVMVYAPRNAFWGGDVAAPIFREVAEGVVRYLCIPPMGSDMKNIFPLVAEVFKNSSS